MNYRLLILLFPALPSALSAQSCGFSEGKNLAELRTAVFAKTPHILGKSVFTELVNPLQQNIPPDALHPIFLPKWSAETLPFFCKIEHNWGLKSRIPIKFRLGSVEYVDWLEGK